MRKWLIASIIFLGVACGSFVYMEWQNRRFAASLPKPPPVEQQSVETHPHEHPHPHEDPVPATPSNTADIEAEIIIVENTDTDPMSEDNTTQVDDEWQTDDVEKSEAAWQTDDEHEHKPAKDPFTVTQIENMDPDEYADMIRVGLLKQFGDIPEVHTFTEFTRKIKKNEELSLDERIEFTTAQYHLWPHPETKKTLEIFLEEKTTENVR